MKRLDNLKNLEVLTLDINHLFQGASYVSKQELEKYIGHLPNLKSFNTYKFPLPE
jgi:hypothetical protein